MQKWRQGEETEGKSASRGQHPNSIVLADRQPAVRPGQRVGGLLRDRSTLEHFLQRHGDGADLVFVPAASRRRPGALRAWRSVPSAP